MKPMNEDRLVALLHGQRWACLGTLDKGLPFVSWAAFALDKSGLLLHLSRLAKHTRNIIVDSTVSISISEPDNGDSDPQQLARITLEGKALKLERESEEYRYGRNTYLARLPDAAMMFDFEDFSLFHFVPHSARYVEGFGSAHRLNAKQLNELIQTD